MDSQPLPSVEFESLFDPFMASSFRARSGRPDAITSFTAFAAGENGAPSDGGERAWSDIADWSKKKASDFEGEAKQRYHEVRDRVADLEQEASRQGAKVSEFVEQGVNEARDALVNFKKADESTWDTAARRTREAIDEAGERVTAAVEALRGK